MITQSERAEFEERGFLCLRGFFPAAEMSALTGLVEAHVREHQQRLAADGAQGVSRAGEISFTQHLAERDRRIAAFVRDERLVALAVSLLGSELELYWDQAVYKLPDTARDFPWHQDNGYTPVEPERYLTVWLALGDVTLENGCLWVLPGSHRDGVRPHVDTPIGKAADAGGNAGIPVEARSGDVLVFSSLLLHKSGPNLSRSERKAYIIQYAPTGVRDKASQLPVGRGLVARSGRAVTALAAPAPVVD